jgi:hypothetical protein
MFNKPTTKVGLLAKISRLAAALGVTRFIAIIAKIWSQFVVQLKSDLDVQHIHF